MLPEYYILTTYKHSPLSSDILSTKTAYSSSNSFSNINCFIPNLVISAYICHIKYSQNYFLHNNNFAIHLISTIIPTDPFCLFHLPNWCQNGHILLFSVFTFVPLLYGRTIECLQKIFISLKSKTSLSSQSIFLIQTKVNFHWNSQYRFRIYIQ